MNIKIAMYNIGAFQINWDEDSETLKGEPTVVTRNSYSGDLVGTATIIRDRFGDDSFLTICQDTYDTVFAKKRRSMISDESIIRHYDGKTWVGQISAKKRDNTRYWKDVAWSSHNWMAVWMFCSLLPQNEFMSIDEWSEVLRDTVTKFERLSS